MKGLKIWMVSILPLISILILGVGVVKGPHLEVSEEAWDFGRVEEGEECEHIFKIKNTGGASLVIERVRTSCGCTGALLSKDHLLPGETGEIKVTFYTEGYSGRISKHVYVISNDRKAPTKSLTITLEVSAKSSTTTPDSPSIQSQSIPVSAPVVRIYYFYSQNCRDCQYIKEKYLPKLIDKYQEALEVGYLNLDDPEAYQLMLRLEKSYGRIKNPPPTIFIADVLLDGRKEIEDRLEETIESTLGAGGSDWPKPQDEQQPLDDKTKWMVIERFRGLGPLAIIGGGLIDGINPCAFTTLVCFVSYLFFVGRRGRTILLVGSVFTLTVFACYLLIGIGLFEFIKKITGSLLLSRIVSILVASGALLLGLLSLWDYYLIKSGRLARGCSMRIGKVMEMIKRGSTMRHYLWGAFLLGFLLSFLEFFCTGQVYLPIIAVLRYVPDLRIHALLYLILYNFMFVLPLVLVFILAYYGISSEVVTRLIQRSSGKVRILTAILFFGLAGVLITFGLT